MHSHDDGPLGQLAASADIGAPGAGGACHYDSAAQRYTLVASGGDMWGGHDSCHLAWRALRGDLILSARAALITPEGHEHRKLGLMLRAGAAPDAPTAYAALHGNGLAALQFRRTPGGETEEIQLPVRDADRLQLERVGGVLRMSAARHGELPQSVELAWDGLPDELLGGLFVSSHDAGAHTEAQFEDVRIVAPAPEALHSAGQLPSLLEILDVASGSRRVVLRADVTLEAPNWTPDGRALIYNSGGLIYRLDLASGAVSQIDTGRVRRNNNDHVIAPDGRTLAISSADASGHSVIYTVPIGGGEPYQVTPVGPSYLHGWSPDGQHLVYTALREGDYDVYRIPAAGGPEERLTTAPGLDDGPEYSPDGAHIYFNSVRSGLMQIWRMRPDGSAQEQITDDALNNWFAHLSPDGRQAVYLSYADPISPSAHPPCKRVYLRLMPAGGGPARVLAYLYGGQGTINVPSWSPDGARLAFVSYTGPLGPRA